MPLSVQTHELLSLANGILLIGYSIVCRLVLTAVLLASKMFNDTYYTNRYIAEVGGVSLANMNDLEKYFMQLIDWNLSISTEEF